MKFPQKNAYDFQDLCQIVADLRSPQGCAWDRAQTKEDLIQYVMEEAYEVIDAIRKQDMAGLQEELGDLCIQIVFLAQIAAEQGAFTMDDVCDGVVKKMLFRHPHVFGSDEETLTKEQVPDTWEAQKQKEKQYKSITEQMESVPASMPALLRAYKGQAKAAKVGFDWPDAAAMLDKIKEETQELEAEVYCQDEEDNGNNGKISEELGDLMLVLSNFSRFFALNPEIVLTNAIEKFINRFRAVECKSQLQGLSLADLTLAEMDVLWEETKHS